MNKRLPVLREAPERGVEALAVETQCDTDAEAPARGGAVLDRGAVLDARGRPLADLRISVTDRCNFRCTYCMPRETFGADFPFLARDELLSYEEITRIARQFVALGVGKLRVTGGEPLLRRDLARLIAQLRELGPALDIALTTNGVLLSKFALELKQAGMSRVTVSLDSLDQAVFARMTDGNYRVEQVLEGIAAAERAGLAPVKINAVVRKGYNERSIVELARHFRGTGHIVRFIEFMDVGTKNGWRMDEVVSAREIVAAVHAQFPLEPVESNYLGEVAGRYRYLDGGGEIGVISSVTQPFCGDCSRARLSSEGKLYTCLFSGVGVDLRQALRAELGDAGLGSIIRRTWQRRSDRYSEQRGERAAPAPRVEMSHIGG